jgi:hypothetical protein
MTGWVDASKFERPGGGGGAGLWNAGHPVLNPTSPKVPLRRVQGAKMSFPQELNARVNRSV